jgi:uncharacterized protein YgbK (DUF1537 family)
MMRMAVIADDLTGAADTGIQFCRPEVPTYLLGPDHLRSFRFPESPHSLSLFTNTRGLSAGQAEQMLKNVAPSVRRLRPLHLYKKIDSCLRGNIGAELDALADSMSFEATFISPALPAQGRTVLHDVHYLRGVPLAETEMARDPVSPVTESRASVHLGRQSRYPVARVDLDLLERCSEDLAESVRKLIRQGARHIVFDAAGQHHLDRVAELAVSHFPGSLLVGSAGLASSLSGLLFPDRPGTAALPYATGNRILLVCGSASEVLGAQIQELVRSIGCPSYALDAAELASSKRGPWIHDRSRAAARDLSQRSVVLSIKPPVLTCSPSRGQEILKGLAELVLSVISVVRPDSMLLSGGDTAFEVWKALQAEAMLLAQELLPGFVLGTFCKGLLHGLPVVVKPGAFGAPDALVRVHEMMSSGKVQTHGSQK